MSKTNGKKPYWTTHKETLVLKQVLKCFKLDSETLVQVRNTIQYSGEHNPLKTVTFLISLVNRGAVQLEHHKQLKESVIIHTSAPSTSFSQEKTTARLAIFFSFFFFSPEEKLNTNVNRCYAMEISLVLLLLVGL